MESLVGRLNHIAFLMHMLKHFMSRLWMALCWTQTHKFTYLKSTEKADLELMLFFLQIAALKGVSLNNLSFRKPTDIYRLDASLHGIRWFNILLDTAWLLQSPVNCCLRTTLNSLEFIAASVAFWIDYINGVISPESCILSQIDSTSVAGWIKKSNFSDSEEEIVQFTTARKLASIVLDAESYL